MPSAPPPATSRMRAPWRASSASCCTASSFAAEYRERVFRHFLREHEAGRTPNPDVLCNREIKFGVALEWARRLGATHFATGHYARLLPAADGLALCKGVDAAKDQSYFLHALTRGAARAHADAARRAAQERGARARAPRRAAGVRQARQHRDLLHRRAAVSRIPRPLSAAQPRPHTTRPRASGSAPTRGWPSTPSASAPGSASAGAPAGPRSRGTSPRRIAASNALIVVQGGEHPLLAGAGLVTGQLALADDAAARAVRGAR